VVDRWGEGAHDQDWPRRFQQSLRGDGWGERIKGCQTGGKKTDRGLSMFGPRHENPNQEEGGEISKKAKYLAFEEGKKRERPGYGHENKKITALSKSREHQQSPGLEETSAKKNQTQQGGTTVSQRVKRAATAGEKNHTLSNWRSYSRGRGQIWADIAPLAPGQFTSFPQQTAGPGKRFL